MLSILIAVGSVAWTFGTVKAGVSTLLVAYPLGLTKKNYMLRRELRLGTNSEFARRSTEEFVIFTLTADLIPEGWEDDLKMEFCLTLTERTRLNAMLMYQMLKLGKGNYAEKVADLCRRANIPVDEFEDLIADTATSIRGIEELMWLSKNRLNDPILQMRGLGKKQA